MNLQLRIDLLVRLGQYLLSDDEEWTSAKRRAEQANNWFTQQFISKAVTSIAEQYLQHGKLVDFTHRYRVPESNQDPKTIGLVMAGNIPLVGFHDWLCLFLTGQRARVKTSSKDDILFKHLAGRLLQWEPGVDGEISFPDLLKGCDAYIATGSNNTARYFEYYFSKYPHIIRKNRTSVAILTGGETEEDLERLADDIYLYFGLGCRNVTKLYIPRDYDFVPLLGACKKYSELINHHKYKNNYDYQLAIYLLNNQYYMTNNTVLLVEGSSLFSAISQLNYEFYDSLPKVIQDLGGNREVQCIVGNKWVPFGSTQSPYLTDYADQVDTMQFLTGL